MKKTVKLGVALLALAGLTSALAATPGTYVGAGLGYTKLNSATKYLPASSAYTQTSTQNHLGGRAFVGYNFNENFGVEGGYNYYAKSTYTVKNSAAKATVDNSLQTFDVVGKAYLPIPNSGFNVYALGGAAYVNSKLDANGKNNVTGVTLNDSKTTNRLRPKFGVGASYDVPNSPISTSLELTRVVGTGDVNKSNTAIPNADAAILSVSYNLG